MELSLASFLRGTLRRRIVCLMALSTLIAGIAQAAHYHKDDPARSSSADVHCLLCLYASSTAGPPALQRVPHVKAACLDYRPPHSIPCPESLHAASYEARGPPKV